MQSIAELQNTKYVEYYPNLELIQILNIIENSRNY